MEENIQSQEVKMPEINLDEKRFNIQLKKNDKVFLFSVPDQTPYGEAYDACLEILVALNGMINEATKKVAPEVVEPIVDNQSN